MNNSKNIYELFEELYIPDYIDDNYFIIEHYKANVINIATGGTRIISFNDFKALKLREIKYDTWEKIKNKILDKYNPGLFKQIDLDNTSEKLYNKILETYEL